MRKHWTELLFDDVKLYFPSVAERTKKWWIRGKYEVVLELENGDLMSYYELENTMRRLPRPDEDISEERWRKEFGIRFRRLRLLSGKSQLEISKETGVPTSRISEYANGKRTPSFYTASKLAKALGCSVDELI